MLVRLRECIHSARSRSTKSAGDSVDDLRSNMVVSLAFEALHLVASLPLLVAIPSLRDLLANIIRILDAAVYADDQQHPMGPPTTQRHTFVQIYRSSFEQRKTLEAIESDFRDQSQQTANEIDSYRRRIADFESTNQQQALAARAVKLEALKSSRTIDSLQSQVSQLKAEIEALRAAKSDLERSLFESELESLERQRVADQAVAEYQRISLEHHMQQRLLAQVDFNPARLTRAPQTSAIADNGVGDDSLRNELDTAYRERDLLLEQVEALARDRVQLDALYRRENQAKNTTLLRLAQLKDDHADLQGRYQDALESRTPRPDWPHVCQRFDPTCRLCARYDLRVPSSTVASAQKVLLVMGVLEERTKELDDLRRQSARQADIDEGLYFDVPGSCRWTSRYLVPYDNAHEAQSKVPSWLRLPSDGDDRRRFQLRNRHLNLKTVTKMIGEIWAAHDPGTPDINDTLKAYFESRTNGIAIEALELAYNFADALDRHRWVYNCHLLREVIRGRLNWRCSRLADQIEESLMNAMLAVDRRVRGKRTNKVARGLFLEQCAVVFPNKSDDARAAYTRALQRSATGSGILIDYRSLLEAGAANDFLETIRAQLLADLVDHQKALLESLRRRSDSDGGITLAQAVEALDALHTDVRPELVHSLFHESRGGGRPPPCLPDDDDNDGQATANVGNLLRLLTLHMVLHPRDLFVVVSAPAETTTAEKGLGRSSSHVTRRLRNMRLGTSLSGSKSTAALPEKIDSDGHPGDDADSALSKTPSLSRTSSLASCLSQAPSFSETFSGPFEGGDV